MSILREGKLWGLISCHHREPRHIPFQVRVLCDLLARTFSLRLTGLESTATYTRRIEVSASYARLLAAMADRLDYVRALSDHAEEVLAFANATGAAIITDEQCVLMGVTPDETAIRSLTRWLIAHPRDAIFASDALSEVYPAARDFSNIAAGVLALRVSMRHEHYVLWFRPAVTQTVNWGGQPSKGERYSETGELLISPRKSFETWQQHFEGRSQPWATVELEAAAELRHALISIVLRRADEIAALNTELLHSNRELEAFSYSVSHDLRAPLRHIAGYAELLQRRTATSLAKGDQRYLRTIIESAAHAGELIDRLLEFSRLGRSQIATTPVDLNVLVAEIQDDLVRESVGRDITSHIADLPVVEGDMLMLRVLFRNLLENAVKYSAQRAPAIIDLEYQILNDVHQFALRENGVGFDMEYAEKAFGVFQRLHRVEDFPGSGIGLANARRVVERHGGKIWVHANKGEGAAFQFTLPVPAYTRRLTPTHA